LLAERLAPREINTSVLQEAPKFGQEWKFEPGWHPGVIPREVTAAKKDDQGIGSQLTGANAFVGTAEAQGQSSPVVKAVHGLEEDENISPCYVYIWR
jgi:hypothetical protein